MLSDRRRVVHQCELPLPPGSNSAVWICPECDTMWRWNYLGEWWEEEL